jgi:NitT/TauT family transport system substrate-binding protein
MTTPASSRPDGLTCLGKVISGVLVLGLIAMGAWIAFNQFTRARTSATQSATVTEEKTEAGFDTKGLAETQTSVPRLAPAQAYVPKDDVIDIELSEYAGYAGLIVANGGLEPGADSYLAKTHKIKLRIKISEEESWSALNAGKMAASATTADVLAVYGRQMQVVVPAQIGYSRGADGLVVRNDIRKVNDLKGKTIAAAEFTESDFFLRYLASEAGLKIKMLPDLKTAPDADAVNLVFTEDGFAAGDLFLSAVKANSLALAGCVTWAPKTSEIPAESNGKAKLLVSNKNLLIIADILIVNRGFAEKNPDKVQALVDGLLAGNKTVRDNPEANVDMIGKAFKWDRAKTLAELQKVHLSNLPEQLAFFRAGIKQGGSFASIYQSAVIAYGSELVPNPVDSEHFLALDALSKIEAAGAYKDQVASITPLASGPTAMAEVDPVLSQDIRFYFEPNSANLDMSNADNLRSLNNIKRILDIAPGSHIILVGHVDNSKIPQLRSQGGEELVRKTALEAIQLSKDRATEIRNKLAQVEKVEVKRLETIGRGWEQPVSTTNPELNRRVEVQWFTLE